ncbi:hypothetical protein NKG05_24090 [Oerskovia sp. M15]
MSREVQKERVTGGAGVLRRGVLGLSALLLMSLGMVGTAQGDEKDTADIRFSVTTATPDGPDERRIFDVVAEPGEQVQDQVAVSNHGAAAVTFEMVTNDGIFTPMGKFDIRTSDQEPLDSGGWFEVQPTVDVPAGETVIVPFTITVPRTPPGRPPGRDRRDGHDCLHGGRPGVGVESRVGVRVNIRVPGRSPRRSPSRGQGILRTLMEPLRTGRRPGDLRRDQRRQPAGRGGAVGARLRCVRARRHDGRPRHRGARGTHPGTSRSSAFTVAGIWPLGPVTTEITITPTPVSTGGAADVPSRLPWSPSRSASPRGRSRGSSSSCSLCSRWS